MSIRLPGVLYAALQVCHPAPGALPAWLHRRAARYATGAVVDVGQEHAEELADLVAHAWWELQQDDTGDPFAAAFTAACAAYLDPAAPRPPLDPAGPGAAHSTLSEGNR
ncbi:hypothetical protein [Streptomyces sp. NPDC088775]|uniref:hypothetical protein n=1 Tax=Streptomyces sp. NPDC088775 TaxID=3365896 RepID=UPI00382D47C2